MHFNVHCDERHKTVVLPCGALDSCVARACDAASVGWEGFVTANNPVLAHSPPPSPARSTPNLPVTATHQSHRPPRGCCPSTLRLNYARSPLTPTCTPLRTGVVALQGDACTATRHTSQATPPQHTRPPQHLPSKGCSHFIRPLNYARSPFTPHLRVATHRSSCPRRECPRLCPAPESSQQRCPGSSGRG